MNDNVYRGRRKACYAISWALIALSVLCVLGLLVCLVLFGFNMGGRDTLFLILSGTFLGGTVVFALFGVWTSRVTVRLLFLERDMDERAISEESFFAGEGVFATFTQNCLTFGKGTGAEIAVPYSQIRATRVCKRTAPRMKGEWYILLQIPTCYLSKKGEGDELLPVQFDYKQRLLDCIERYEIPLDGEEKKDAKGTFKKVKRFQKWDKGSCVKYLIEFGVGAFLFFLGIGLTYFLPNATFGAVILAIGGLFAVKSGFSLFRSKYLLVAYEEGFYKKANGEVNAFFRWEEIRHVSKKREGENDYLVFDCGYGDFICREVDGFFEYVSQKFPHFTEEKP